MATSPRGSCESDPRNEPVFTIGVVARKLRVTPMTLRIWEKRGLIQPSRIGKNRFYSEYDLTRLAMIEHLLQEKHLNIEGVKEVLELKRCWEIRGCTVDERSGCPRYRSEAQVIVRSYGPEAQA